MRDLPRSTAIARCSFGIGFAGGLGITEGMVARGHVRLVGNHKLGRRAPEAFQVVVAPGLLAEDVQDESSEINQSPFRGSVSFAVFRGAMKLFFELVFHFAADRLHLRSAETRADHEIVGEGSDAAEIKNGNAGSFFVLCGFDSQADALWQRV